MIATGAHSLGAGAAGTLVAAKEGRPMANSFRCRFELAAWT
jgi:hypothetical protein